MDNSAFRQFKQRNDFPPYNPPPQNAPVPADEPDQDDFKIPCIWYLYSFMAAIVVSVIYLMIHQQRKVMFFNFYLATPHHEIFEFECRKTMNITNDMILSITSNGFDQKELQFVDQLAFQKNIQLDSNFLYKFKIKAELLIKQMEDVELAKKDFEGNCFNFRHLFQVQQVSIKQQLQKHADCLQVLEQKKNKLEELKKSSTSGYDQLRIQYEQLEYNLQIKSMSQKELIEKKEDRMLEIKKLDQEINKDQSILDQKKNDRNICNPDYLTNQIKQKEKEISDLLSEIDSLQRKLEEIERKIESDNQYYNQLYERNLKKKEGFGKDQIKAKEIQNYVNEGIYSEKIFGGQLKENVINASQVFKHGLKLSPEMEKKLQRLYQDIQNMKIELANLKEQIDQRNDKLKNLRSEIDQLRYQQTRSYDICQQLKQQIEEIERKLKEEKEYRYNYDHSIQVINLSLIFQGIIFTNQTPGERN